MNSTEFKNLLIKSLDKESDPWETSKEIEKAGVTFGFRENFSEKVLDKVFGSGSAAIREVEFTRSLKYVLYRVALTGVAAIVLLLISLFIMEGSFSLNSILGLGDTYDESIVCLLTGN